MKIGIDVGGTNTVVAVVENNTIIRKNTYSTPTDLPGSQFLEWLNASTEEFLAVSDVDEQNIGIALPGLVRGNTLIHAPALPKCDNLSFDRWHVCNDADAAAKAELAYGAAKGADNAVVITFGTSIGSGIIIGGKLKPGSEMGHMIVEANQRMEWGALASTSALVARCRKNHGDVEWTKNGKTIVEAAQGGAPPACEELSKHIRLMSIGISNIINILTPELVVVGGGISAHFDYFGEELNKQTESLLIFPSMMPQIVRAKFGGDAGVIGACI